jgi:YbgC/YbaW family acyl-CoA thioester hydrolase
VLTERPWRVTMADVDAAGIIYYASPLRWAEVLLGDWLDQAGHSLATMLGGGEAIPVVGVEVRYRAPLGLDDHLRLRLSAQRVGTTSFTTRCDVWGPRGEEDPAVEVAVTHAFVGYAPPRAGQSAVVTKQALPPWLRNALAAGGDSGGPDDMGGERCAQK